MRRLVNAVPRRDGLRLARVAPVIVVLGDVGLVVEDSPVPRGRVDQDTIRSDAELRPCGTKTG